MPTLNASSHNAIEPADLSTFQSPPKHKLIRGPAKLYRFGDSRGRWWFDADLLQTLKEDFYETNFGDASRGKNQELTLFLRYVLAVSREWNKFALVSTLTLRQDEDIDTFIGPAAPQPEWRKKADGPTLAGGMLQYLIYRMDLVPSRCLSEMPLSALVRKWY